MRFSQIDEDAPKAPGIYEIRTFDGVPLKVGIATDLRKRLLANLFARYPEIRKGMMGFPDDWEDSPIWSSSRAETAPDGAHSEVPVTAEPIPDAPA